MCFNRGMENTSITITPQPRAVARKLAVSILESQGYEFNFPTAEFVHTDGRRGRLAYFPLFKDGEDTGLVKGVALQLPGRRPTTEDLLNRVSTVGGFLPVWGEVD